MWREGGGGDDDGDDDDDDDDDVLFNLHHHCSVIETVFTASFPPSWIMSFVANPLVFLFYFCSSLKELGQLYGLCNFPTHLVSLTSSRREYYFYFFSVSRAGLFSVKIQKKINNLFVN